MNVNVRFNSPRHKRAERFLSELEIVANAHCQTQRFFGSPVSYCTLLLALRRAFGLADLGMIVEFSRRYVDEWTRAEELAAHESMQEVAT